MNPLYKAENKLAGRCAYCGVDDAEVHLAECPISLKHRMDTLSFQLTEYIYFMNSLKSLSYEFDRLEAKHQEVASICQSIKQRLAGY